MTIFNNYGTTILLFLAFYGIQVCQGLDFDNILQAVNISQAAYCINDSNEWTCATCNPQYTYETRLEHQGEQIIFGWIPDYNAVFIGFRGSSNIQNWIDNIQCRQITPYDDKQLSVEKGFYNLFSSLDDMIYNILDVMVVKYNTNTLFITGHSLGGALASLMAFDVKYNNRDYNVKSVITFGSPRVGNPYFSTIFNRFQMDSYRITHHYDMVPHVPEEFMGYQHVTQEIYLSENNDQYTICNDAISEDNYCSNKCAPLHCTSISDHMNYLNISMGTDGLC